MANAVRHKFQHYFDLENIEDPFQNLIVVISALKLINYWPLSARNWRFTLYMWSTAIVLYIPFSIGQIYCIYINTVDGNYLEKLSENTATPEVIFGICKVIYMKDAIWKVQQLFEKITNDSLFKARNLQQKLIAQKYRKLTYLLCVISYLMTAFAVSIIVAEPIFFNQPFEFDFPFFDVYKSPIYEILHIWRLLIYIFGPIATASYDLIACGMMIYLICQIDLLANELENLKIEEDDNLEPTEEQLQPIYENFHYCIRKYQAIRNICVEFSSIYDPMIFSVFAATAITLCFTLYSLTVVKIFCLSLKSLL